MSHGNATPANELIKTDSLFNRCLQAIVHRDTALFVQLDANILKKQSKSWVGLLMISGRGIPPDRDSSYKASFRRTRGERHTPSGPTYPLPWPIPQLPETKATDRTAITGVLFGELIDREG